MLDAAQLDISLQKLARTPAYETRVRALQSLVEYWHGPIGPADGYSVEELASLELPQALRWWYSWIGKRKEIVSADGMFRAPEHLFPPEEDSRIHIWAENQGVFYRAVSTVGEDPLVYQSDWNHGDEWRCEGMSLLELLMQLCVFEAKSEYWGFLDLEESQLQAFTSKIPRLPASPWQTPDPAYEFAVDFHVGRGIYAVVHNLIGAYSLTVRAKSASELKWLDELLPGEKWEVREF